MIEMRRKAEGYLKRAEQVKKSEIGQSRRRYDIAYDTDTLRK